MAFDKTATEVAASAAFATSSSAANTGTASAGKVGRIHSYFQGRHTCLFLEAESDSGCTCLIHYLSRFTAAFAPVHVSGLTFRLTSVLAFKELVTIAAPRS